MRMNQSNEDSRKLEVTGFWFCEDLNKLKNNEKGLSEAGDHKRKDGNEKNPELIQEIQVGKVGDAILFENGTIKLDNGKKIENFADYKMIKKQNKNRKTAFSKRAKEAGVGLE